MATETAGVTIKTELDPKGLDDFKTRIQKIKGVAASLGKGGGLDAFNQQLKTGIGLAKQQAQELEKVQREADQLRAKASAARGAFTGALKDGAKAVGGTLASGIRTAATAATAGAIAIVAGNMQAEKSFRKLSFSMEASGKAGVKWNDLQKKSFAVSKQFGGSQEELAAGASAALEKSGNADFALESLEAIAMASRATGHDMGALGELAGELNSKFGVTAEQLPDAFAGIAEMAAKGGQSVEEITASMDALGKAAARSGIEGVDGLKQMIALSQKMADAAGGETAAMSKLSKVMVALGPAADAKMKAQLKSMGVVQGKSGIETLGSLLKATKGDEAKLAKVLGGEQAALLSQGLGAGGFGEAMAASKTTMQGGRLKEIAEEIGQSPAAKLEAALNTLAERLSQPDFTSAIANLTSQLPKLADSVVSVINAIGNNPELAVGGLVASQAIGPAMGAAAIGSKFMDWRAARAAAQVAPGAVAAATGGGATAAATAATTGLQAVGPAATSAAGGIAAMAKTVGAAGLAIGALSVAYVQAAKLMEELDYEHQTYLQGRKNFQEVTDKAAEGGEVQKLSDMMITKQNQIQAMAADPSTFDPKVFNDLVFDLGMLGSKLKRAQGEQAKREVTAEYEAAYPEHFGPGATEPIVPASIAAIQASSGAAGASIGGAIGADIGKAPKAGGMSAGDKALFDAMMNSNKDLGKTLGAQTLQVRIVNPEDLKAAQAGYAPRE